MINAQETRSQGWHFGNHLIKSSQTSCPRTEQDIIDAYLTIRTGCIFGAIVAKHPVKILPGFKSSRPPHWLARMAATASETGHLIWSQLTAVSTVFYFDQLKTFSTILFHWPRLNWLALAVLAWALSGAAIGRFETVHQWEGPRQGTLGKAGAASAGLPRCGRGRL